MKRLCIALFLASVLSGCDLSSPPYEKIDWDYDGRTDATLIWGKEKHLEAMVINEPPKTVNYRFIATVLSHGQKVLKQMQLDDKPGQKTYVYTQKPFILFSQTLVKGQGDAWGFYKYNVLERVEYDRNQDGRADYIISMKKLRRERIIADDDYNGDFEIELKRGEDF